MEVRTTALPGHVEYHIDCATEGGEIDWCVSNTLRLYGDADVMDEIIGSPLTIQDIRDRVARLPLRPWNNRRSIAEELTAHAEKILPQLPIERQGALIYSGIASLFFIIASSTEYWSNCAISDAIDGGYLEPYRRGRHLRIGRNGKPFKNMMRRLHSPSFIRRYVKRSEPIEELRQVANAALRRLDLVPIGLVRDAGEDLRRELNAQMEAGRIALREREDRMTEAFRAEAAAGRKAVRQMRAKVRARRRVLKRASVMAAGILGMATVGALARGEPIRIDGPTVTLEVQRRTSLAAIGHGTLAISLLDHGGTRLADLCVYIDDTPAIDQVTGFALCMRSGLEAEVLKTANLTMVTPAGKGHPAIATRRVNQIAEELLRPRDEVMERAAARHIQRRTTWEDERTRNEAYWKATEKIWLAAVAARVLGSNRRALAALCSRTKL